MLIDIHAHLTTNLDQYRRRAAQAGFVRPVLLSTAVHPEKAATLAGVRAELEGLSRLLDGAATAEGAYASSQAEVRAALDVWPEDVTMRKIALQWPPERILAAAAVLRDDRRSVSESGPLVDSPAWTRSIALPTMATSIWISRRRSRCSWFDPHSTRSPTGACSGRIPPTVTSYAAIFRTLTGSSQSRVGG